MRRWPGATRSALLTIAAAYIVLLIDFWIWGVADATQASILLVDILVPAIGAAYGIFFFHWLFESGRAATYPDYSFGIWLISACISLVYMGIFAGFAVLIPYCLMWMPSDLFQFLGGTIVSWIDDAKVYASQMIDATDYFTPFLWRSVGLFIVLELFACWLGKKEGMRHYTPAETGPAVPSS